MGVALRNFECGNNEWHGAVKSACSSIYGKFKKDGYAEIWSHLSYTITN